MLLSYGRDTSSELWTPVLFFTSHTIYCNTCFTVFFANNHLPHNTVNPLLQQAGEIDNLTVSLGQSTLVVLCRFHVGAGIPGVAPHYISPPSTFNVLLGSYWFDKPWFHTEGNLLLYASYLPLGVPNGRVHLRVSAILNIKRPTCLKDVQ